MRRSTLLPASLLLVALAASCTSDPRVASPTEAVDDVLTISYGDGDVRVADLRVPARAQADDAAAPVVVLIHGGFWRHQYERDLMTPLAEDLTARGYATWNIEYHRVGMDGGGWPGTFADVAASVDALGAIAPDHGLDLDRVVTLGHSAGGHLAVWAAGRSILPADAPGGSPTVQPCAAISLAGVLDLANGAAERVGGRAIPDLMGGTPSDVPDRYRAGDPAQFVDAYPVPALLVHGEDDDIVPLSQSEAFTGRAGIQLVAPPRTDHFAVIDPDSAAWAEVIARLPALCP